MAKDAIVFACANPTPEIFPDEAKAGGAAVVSTGRSDYPNQINNVLAFPGVFRGAFDVRAKTTSPDTGRSSRCTTPRNTLPGLLYFVLI